MAKKEKRSFNKYSSFFLGTPILYHTALCTDHRDLLICNETFEKFLATVNNRTRALLRWSLKTVIIDMAGVLNHGFDIRNIVACDIFHANCTPQKGFYEQSDERPLVENAKDATHSVTSEQMQMINEAFENNECNFISIQDHRNLTILYQDSLARVFSECRVKSNTSTVLDRKGLLDSIVQIPTNI